MSDSALFSPIHIGGSSIRFSPISFTTDFEQRVHLWLYRDGLYTYRASLCTYRTAVPFLNFKVPSIKQLNNHYGYMYTMYTTSLSIV
jgi:hypothetical protein